MIDTTIPTPTQLLTESFAKQTFEKFGMTVFTVNDSCPVAIKTNLFHAANIGLVIKLDRYKYKFSERFNPSTFAALVRKEAARYSGERGKIRKREKLIESNTVIFNDNKKPTEKDLIKMISDLYGVGCKIEITLPQPNKISFTS